MAINKNINAANMHFRLLPPILSPNRTPSNPYITCLASISEISILSTVTVLLLINQFGQTSANSASHGFTNQQASITDISALMPKLCQNQTVICEGSFCIPGIRRCVCDLRNPVQFDRFCLRQVDIETKCFVTSQCNHTIKDAVCTDINSNSILDISGSKIRLEQWQQLNDLRKMSQPTPAKQLNRRSVIDVQHKTISNNGQQVHLTAESSAAARGQANVITYSNVRTSPYEINYNTPELLHQNHTRRRIDNQTNTVKLIDATLNEPPIADRLAETTTTATILNQPDATIATNDRLPTGGIVLNTKDMLDQAIPSIKNDRLSTTTTKQTTNVETSTPIEQATTSSSASPNLGNDFIQSSQSKNDLSVNQKKFGSVKTLHWPPGICSCPPGYMFDPMIRKCLALSLKDSHCLNDTDCKQIVMTHCSLELKKCECDEPLVWDPKQLLCKRLYGPNWDQRPNSKLPGMGFVDQILASTIAALPTSMMPDHRTILFTMLLVLSLIGILIVAKITMNCFSSKNSVLISPKKKNRQKKTKGQMASPQPPRSPYATLRFDQKHASQLSDMNQTTRGRILNYDFEQESPKQAPSVSPQPPKSASNTLKITFLLLA